MLKKTTLSFILLGSVSVYAATSMLTSPSEEVKAQVNIQQTKVGLRVKINASGLKPNSLHGIHVHENGVCEAPTFESAGGHFNPHKKVHGGPQHIERHFGDWGNLKSNRKGVAQSELFFEGVPAGDVQSLVGKSIVIHAQRDDMGSQPSGATGERIACGIIMP